ncbi:MAG: hypothetical protein NTX82_00860 [Candidatus Parcubacteria bacterium]|nr:hypothetical protein [Candidatus Parcubacteria bacterium]
MNDLNLAEIIDTYIANILATPEVALSSSLSKIESHSDFNRLISFGSAIVPLLLRHLQKEPDWVCLIALRKITGQWPCQKHDAGILLDISNAWLAWGRDNGYIK